MGKKTDTGFDDGLRTREQDRAYGEAIIQMGEPRSKRPRAAAKIIVWGSLSVLVVGMGASLALTNANRSLNVELSKTLETQYNPSFRVRFDSIGGEVINAWYAKQNPPIDVDSTVAWPTGTGTAASGKQLSAAPKGTGQSDTANNASTAQTLTVSGVAFLRGSQIQDRGPGKRYTERLEYYALFNGVPQVVGVTIAIPDLDDLTSEPVLVAPPSIIGKPTTSSVQAKQENSPATTLGSAQFTDAATAAVNSWAKAWTEDDSAALKQATHDADAGNVYRGLGSGWVYVPGSAKVVWSALAPQAGGNAVARVTWDMQTPAITPQTGSASNQTQPIPGVTQTQTMDVLIGAYQSGSPSVLAWGQPGTYLELKAGYNAITKDSAATMAPAAPQASTGAVAPTSPANTGVNTGKATTTGKNG